MRVTRFRTALSAIFCSLPAALHPVAAADIPWPDGAAAHYRVEVAGDREGNQTNTVCGVRFFSGGLLARDAQAVRVTDSKGAPLPLQVVYTHPLNASLVLFSLKQGEETYHLFFGGSVASGVAPTNFGRGMFYETRARPEGDTTSWDAVRKRWAEATNSHGIAILEDTQSRCNPFDESDNQFMSRTWGSWLTPREDVYKLGVFTKDQGFLSVNGVPVASTVLDPTTKTQPISDAIVPRGVQSIEILQAKQAGPAATAVSWLMPWPEYYYGNLVARPIQPAWLPRVVNATACDHAVRGQPFWAFFNDFQADLLLVSDQPITVMQFHNRSGGKTDGLTYQWDFGDGTTSAEANPMHVYVKPGRYVVTLTAGGTSKFQKTVLATSFAALPVSKVPSNGTVSPWAAAEAMRLVTPYLDKYDAGTLWNLMALAEQIPDRKARAEVTLKLGPMYLSKSGTIPTQVELPVRQKLADAKADLGQIDAAVAELKQLEPKLEKQRTLRTKLRLQIGKLYQRGAKYPPAIDTYAQIVNERGGDDPKMERTAQIALGDSYLQQGNLGAARKEYELAARIVVGDDRTERERAIRRGSLYSTLRQAVNELSKLALDTSGTSEIGNRDAVATLAERARNSFDSLAFEFPDARLNPDVLYLNASLLLATGDEEGCRAELDTLAKVEPTGRYTLRSMLLQARILINAKEYEKSITLLEAVLKSTQEEPLVKEATTLKTIATDAAASKVKFADATKKYWPNNLFSDGSFEKAAIEAGKPLPFQIEWSTPNDAAQAKDFRLSIVNGFGADGNRCLKLETSKPISAPLYITVRFPTAIGDRVFVRCRVLCNDLDFCLGELRRTSTQSENVYSIAGYTTLVMQQWGWLEQIVNVERWRQFSWRSGLATAGEPSGYFTVIGFLPPSKKTISNGTTVYLDAIECYLAK